MTDTQLVRRLFDDLAAEYDQHLPFFATFGRELVSWCELRPGRHVLDLATGRGAVAVPAALAVGAEGRVLAIDSAPTMVRALAADHGDLPQLSAQVMDAYRLALPDSSFDVVTCGFTLHFLEDTPRALAEAHRVLKPGGLLAFSGPGRGIRHDDRWDFLGELFAEMDEGLERLQADGGIVLRSAVAFYRTRKP